VIIDYFADHSSIEKIPSKDLMPKFIEAGIFESNRDGLPIRKMLRELDVCNQLNLITYVSPERKQNSTRWYFAKAVGNVRAEKPRENKISSKKTRTISRRQSDEAYVIDLCDGISGLKGLRQYTFDFLVGDEGKNGKRRKLPVDVYYPSISLVVEYRERQHTEKVKHFDKPNTMTISGVHRGKQREIYDQRRRTELPKHGIKLIEISYIDFDFDNAKKIVRNKEKDTAIVKELLPRK
jgi:hypothetical protein